VYAVPVLLCAVVLVQRIEVHLVDLSPWKGGGFGMFSTVEAPSARFLRVYLHTQDGDHLVTLPRALASRARELRTAPTLERAKDLARAAAAARWLLLDVDLATRARAAGGGQSNDAPGLDLPVQATPDPREDPLADSAVQPAPRPASVQIYRALGPKETAPKRSRPIELDRVRVEVWQYQFDPDPPRLTARPLLQAEAQRGSHE
jgi:hypothetical protein